MRKLLSAALIAPVLLCSLPACKPGVYMDLRPEAVKQRQLKQQQQAAANPVTTQERITASQQKQQNKANLVIAS